MRAALDRQSAKSGRAAVLGKALLAIVVLAGALTVAVSVTPGVAPGWHRGPATSPRVRSTTTSSAGTTTPVDAVLTPDGPRPYVIRALAGGTGTWVRNPDTSPGQGGNARWSWTLPGATAGTNESACDTWGPTDGTITQQGVVLRLEASDGVERSAVTVLKNVWLHESWIFVVVVWHGTQFRIVDVVDLAATFHSGGILSPLPWRMCAAATGATLEFKVWATSRPEPRFGDPRFGAVVRLPAAWADTSGLPGFYVGHLGAGEYASFTAEESSTA